MAPRKPARLYAAEAPKRWAELRAEELERGNHTRQELAAWARAGKLKPHTLVVWLMPREKARELARHHGRDDAAPLTFAPEALVPLEVTRDTEPGWVLAALVPPPEPEELVVLPPQHLRAWSLEDALARPLEVEALYLHHGKPVLPEIVRLKRLRLLEINQGTFTALPEALLGLEALEWLAIGATPLQSLPPSLGRLGALKCLLLESVALTHLPEVLTELPRLTELRVERAALGPEGEGLELISRLPALRRLEVWAGEPRPEWLAPFGDFTERREGFSSLAVFVRPG